MFTTRSALTACLSISQHSLMKSRCVLASCRAGLWSSFTHLAGFLKLKRMPWRSCLIQVPPERTSSPCASSHSSNRPLVVTALRHSTSVTRMMCSLNRVVSAGDSTLLLPRVSARAALRFQRQGVFGLIPSNIPGRSLWTSHKHRCMLHRVSVFHWSNMSKNQSRTVGSTSTLRRFAVLLLGSSSTSAAAEVGGAAGAAGAARGVLMRASSSCVSGRSMVSPGRHQAGRCKRMPSGSSWWRRMCSSKPQPLLLLHSTRAVACTVKNLKSHRKSFVNNGDSINKFLLLPNNTGPHHLWQCETQHCDVSGCFVKQTSQSYIHATPKPCRIRAHCNIIANFWLVCHV